MYFFWVRVALDGCEPCELWVLCRTCNHTTAMAPRVRPSKPHGSVHTAHTAAAVLRGGYAQGHGFFEDIRTPDIVLEAGGQSNLQNDRDQRLRGACCRGRVKSDSWAQQHPWVHDTSCMAYFFPTYWSGLRGALHFALSPVPDRSSVFHRSIHQIDRNRSFVQLGTPKRSSPQESNEDRVESQPEAARQSTPTWCPSKPDVDDAVCSR